MLEEAYTHTHTHPFVNRPRTKRGSGGGGREERERKTEKRNEKREERKKCLTERKQFKGLCLCPSRREERGDTIGPTLCRPSKKRTPHRVPLTASSERVMKYTNRLVLFK